MGITGRGGIGLKLIVHKYSWIEGIRIPFKCNPLATFIRIMVTFIARVVPTIQIFATAMLIDRALALANGKTDWQALIIPIILIAAFIMNDYRLWE